MNLIATVLIYRGMNELNVFLDLYLWNSYKGLQCYLITYFFFQTLATLCSLLACVDLSKNGTAVVSLSCGVSLVQNIMLCFIAKDEAFNDIFSKPASEYIQQRLEAVYISGVDSDATRITKLRPGSLNPEEEIE